MGEGRTWRRARLKPSSVWRQTRRHLTNEQDLGPPVPLALTLRATVAPILPFRAQLLDCLDLARCGGGSPPLQASPNRDRQRVQFSAPHDQSIEAPALLATGEICLNAGGRLGEIARRAGGFCSRATTRRSSMARISRSTIWPRRSQNTHWRLVDKLISAAGELRRLTRGAARFRRHSRAKQGLNLLAATTHDAKTYVYRRKRRLSYDVDERSPRPCLRSACRCAAGVPERKLRPG